MPYYESNGRFLWLDRVGRWVGIQRGTVGTEGERSIVVTAEADEARVRMNAEVAADFVLVEPTAQPRFVLVSADRFAWFQIRGEMLLEASGALEELETASAQSTFAGSEADAIELRERRVAELVDGGYTPVFFGVGPVTLPAKQKKPPRPRSRRLPVPEPLAARLRANPDEAAWIALAEWVDANVAELRPVLESERAGQAIEPRQLDDKARKLLLGKETALVIDSIVDARWRAAHIVECKLSTFRGSSRRIDEVALFTACCELEAFAFVQALDIRFVLPGSPAALAGLAPQLRALTLSLDPQNSSPTRIPEKGTLPPGLFASMQQLRTLALDMNDVHFTADDSLARVESLSLGPRWPERVLDLPLSKLRSLEIDVRMYPADLTSLLDRIAACAPQLGSLTAVVRAGFREQDHTFVLLDALARSSLLPRLRHLVCDTREERAALGPDTLRSWRGGAFAHLATVELAAIIARRA